MPTFGYIKRTYPILEVIRGWNPNEPFTRTATYPVKEDELILSGMLITPVWVGANSRLEWTIADKDTAGIDTAAIYLAQDDWFKEDVIESGNLVGLSCAGQFEVESAFFTTGVAYVEGAFLTVGDDGKVTLASAGDATEVIVGQVTRAPGNVGDATFKSLVGTNSGVVNTDVITFNTLYIPAHT
jgi:hypothetical protein